ncbi:MAG: PTS lactose transporter subunit IIC [Sphingomonas sp. 28-62-20]|uniref:PTS sugar transporter subunit IIA n=1 Tax=Sphingomonas sp. 28-62-20 TaxID=1970433 RepID=UPI000BDC5A41|nr:MAG: PTS lactose transporter subunit IIC [Sphingomonas sp. 28-62-20]
MTDFSDLLLPQTVLQNVTAGSKKALLGQLASVAGDVYGLDAKMVAAVLGARERIGSTGFGAGIAIPHGKIAGIDQVVGVFARVAQPIDYQAIDDLPVDLVFMMLSPPDSGVHHLKALARVSRRMRDAGFVAKLRGTGSPDALYALWTSDEERDAA